jgi:phosphoglucosamine mutase
MANLGFMKAMEKLGIKTVVTAVGDRSVSDGIAASGAVLGGEQSGHIIFNEYLPTGDGQLTALQVLRVFRSSKAKLSSYKKDFPEFPQVLMNLRVREKIPVENLPDLRSAIAGWEKRLNGNGRILVRYSGTEPLLRVMVEGDSLPKVRSIAQDLVDRAKERLA